MDFNNKYYARLIESSPEAAKEYINQFQLPHTPVEEQKITEMKEYLKTQWIEVWPNFKLATIEKKYNEAKAKEKLGTGT